MAVLPTGTVTFLFTDIVGSTALWERNRAAMQTALSQHHALLRAAIENNGGHVFNIVGDAFCAAFATAPEAYATAVAAQRALRDAMSGATPLQVRMGLHTGSAAANGADYRSGPTLNRVARVMGLAHGGQILLSQTTADLVQREVAGVTLRELGPHRLKGLPEPERIWQVVASDLRQDFPPLAASTAIPNNLPVQLTSFIGREKERGEVIRLLSASRLVTLTGSGGVGKTRLSLRVAADLLDTYRDGIWFVDFAPLSDPALMATVAAGALGVHSSGNTPILDLLTAHLRGKRVLIVLDNCEHMVEASAQFADHLLRHCTGVRLLATSRESLGVSGEQSYRVPSLSLPVSSSTGMRHTTEHAEPIHPDELLQYESIRLFVERAKLMQPAFGLTAQNVASVVQICVRLDGIALAIELAAARVQALSAEQIALRLQDRFRLLTGGSRAGLRRQQTLHATIDWSHDLLPRAEQVLFRRLAVFAGGWTLEAAEAVCGDTAGVDSRPPVRAIDVLDLLTRLVDKSLVIAEERDGAARYRLLETIREYALEKLADAGESKSVRDRHLEFFMRLAEDAQPHVVDEEQVAAFERLETEYNNLRSAMDWAYDSSEMLSLFRLFSALSMFASLRGHHVEFLERSLEALALPESAAPAPLLRLARARTLSHFAYFQSFIRVSTPQQRAKGRSMLAQALATAEELNDSSLKALSLQRLGISFEREGDYVGARDSFERALSFFRGLRDNFGIWWMLTLLGDIDVAENRFEEAEARHAEAAAFAAAPAMKAYSARRLAYHAMRHGDFGAAFERAKQSLQWNLELGMQRGAAASLAVLGLVIAERGNMRHATRLYGATTALLTFVDGLLVSFDRLSFEHGIAAARDQLGAEAFDAVYAEGKRLKFDEAVALALEEPNA